MSWKRSKYSSYSISPHTYIPSHTQKGKVVIPCKSVVQIKQLVILYSLNISRGKFFEVEQCCLKKVCFAINFVFEMPYLEILEFGFLLIDCINSLINKIHMVYSSIYKIAKFII